MSDELRLLDLDDLLAKHPLPRYGDKLVDSRYKKLRESLRVHLDKTLGGDCYEAVKRSIIELLPNVSDQVIHASLQGDVGVELTRAKLDEIAFRLAANWANLLSGKHAQTWVAQRQSEWVVVEIKDVKNHFSGDRSKKTIVLWFRSGHPAGLVSEVSWSLKKLNYLARKRQKNDCCFGFYKYRIPDPDKPAAVYSDYKQLIGLRCFAFVLPGKDQGQPVVATFAHSSGTMAYNKEFIRGRVRQLTKCRLKLPKAPDCWNCIAGRDKCPLAIRAKTLVAKSCQDCGGSFLVDPSHSRPRLLCQTCFTKGSLSASDTRDG